MSFIPITFAQQTWQQGDYDVSDNPTNCKIKYHPAKITRSTLINTILCRSQHYHLLLSPSYSGFAIDVAASTPSAEMMLIVEICNSSTILTSITFSLSTSFGLYWNGTNQQSQLNTDYCFAISSLGNNNRSDVTATPITIEFVLKDSAVVVEYSSISVGNAIMFETYNLLVLVELRDQWNNTIDAELPVVDEDGIVIGNTNSSNEVKYNATLKQGQLISKKTFYLSGVNEHYPHVELYGIVVNLDHEDYLQFDETISPTKQWYLETGCLDFWLR